MESYRGKSMKRNKVIHCRLTEDEHKRIVDAAKEHGVSITKFIIKAVDASLDQSKY